LKRNGGACGRKPASRIISALGLSGQTTKKRRGEEKKKKGVTIARLPNSKGTRGTAEK